MSDISPRTSLLPLAVFAGAVVALAVAVLGALLLSSSGGDGTNATPTVIDTGAVTIDISDFEFAPSNVSVPLGATVTWFNHDGALHDATDDAGAWETETLEEDGSESITFDDAGTFDYHCTIHPYMKARLTVRAD